MSDSLHMFARIANPSTAYRRPNSPTTRTAAVASNLCSRARPSS
jgi:hypothetical protein